MKTNRILAVIIISTLIAACGQKSAQNTAQSSETPESTEPKTAVAEQKAELKIISFAGKELPSKMKYEGEIKNVIRYTDAMGDNCVFTTEKSFMSKNKDAEETGWEELQNAEVYAYHYLINDDGTSKQVWRIYDYTHECMGDTEAHFADNTFNVTDLDNNGIAEVWVLYKKSACATDCCFPNEMKIIMYEGEHKYAMRGYDKVEQITEYEGGRKVTTSEGGEYKFDSAFQNGNSEFQDYAKKMWNDNIIGITLRF